jgi:Transposase DDE domain
MTCGWPTPPRWNAAGPPRPWVAPNWLAGPSTATAPATRATFGGCGCTWSAPSQGLPVGFALTGAKADEREVLLGILAADPTLLAARPGQTLITDNNYFGRQFEAELTAHGVRLLRPARKGEPERPGARLLKPLRQVIESTNDTFKGQLDLERHGGRTPAGVIVRVLQRILALTAAIWHNDHAGQPTARSLVAYDH